MAEYPEGFAPAADCVFHQPIVTVLEGLGIEIVTGVVIQHFLGQPRNAA
jgi:hypothetical protein